MAIKILAFDIDGTLAKTEEVIPPHISARLRELEDSKLRIFFISGRTASYLAGLARGIDLSRIDELYEVVLGLEAVCRYDFKLHKYYDAVEVLPKQNSKGKALAVIKQYLDLKTEEVVAIGNTIVDIPMKSEAKEFLFIGDSIKESGIQNFNSIEEAFVYIEKSI